MKEKTDRPLPDHIINTKYCDKCGAHLTFTYKQYGYSQSTGFPEYWVQCQCPNSSWYSWGHYCQEFVSLCHDKESAIKYTDEGNK